MRWLLLALLGLAELLYPRRLVDWGMKWTFKNDPPYELRPWTTALVRAEGLAFLYIALRGALRRRRNRAAKAA
jgi:hypothetical protein